MNTETEKILERMRIVFNCQSDSELSKAIDTPKQTISTWKQRDSTPYSLCVHIAKDKNISLDWLLTGEGEMSKGKPPCAKISPKLAKMAELLDGLNEDQQREVFATVAEKKRLNTLEATIAELLKRTA